MKQFNSPVYPIPPSFKIDESIDLESTKKYINYLKQNGAKILMTTAGTSQFNLLDKDEIRSLNQIVSEFDGKKIIGLPSLSMYHLETEIRLLNDKNLEDCSLLIIFPERYYNDEQVVKFFEQVTKISNYPVLAHGNPIKVGNGGNLDYGKNLLKKLSKIPNFIGIKEESSSLDFASKNLSNLNLEIIVAGGSMSRFWFLQPFGATTYLTGVGSFNPKIEEDFYMNYSNENFEEAKKIMENYEKPLFETFMNLGWHASMRYALNQMGYIQNNRKPFVELTESEKILIEQKTKIFNQWNKH